jgi:transcription termination/antitermination protein NusG
MDTSLFAVALAQTAPALSVAPQSRSEYIEPHWYAAYTCANHEKRVAEQLCLRSIEYFLPLYQTVRKWKDRRKRLEVPLFPGYIFVRLPLQERLRVLEIPSVARLVGFDHLPTPLPDDEVEALRNALTGQFRAVPHPYLKVGRRVRIIRGPLESCEGILLRNKGDFRVVLSVELIMRSVAVEVGAEDIVPVSASTTQIASSLHSPA